MADIMNQTLRWGFKTAEDIDDGFAVLDVLREPGLRIETLRDPYVEVRVYVGRGKYLSHQVDHDLNVPDEILEKVKTK